MKYSQNNHFLISKACGFCMSHAPLHNLYCLTICYREKGEEALDKYLLFIVIIVYYGLSPI